MLNTNLSHSKILFLTDAEYKPFSQQDPVLVLTYAEYKPFLQQDLVLNLTDAEHKPFSQQEPWSGPWQQKG